MTVTDLALQKNINDVLEEYNQKAAAADDALKAFQKAGDDLKTAATMAGHGEMAGLKLEMFMKER